MKNLTPELKRQSEAKWEEIVRRLEAEEKGVGWRDTYWHECGFCKAVLPWRHGCGECDLFEAEKETPVCCVQGDASHGWQALANAAAGDLPAALRHARIVLEAIRETETDPEA